ncbi:Hypothetical predicted protein [Octopus vulgaris]|uniref:Uncharacterized protein n=1 Tax=Octopus vulgaris TaxID=6645 RepID=A0AA36AL66_OCTVU|nr:Hypothetical predicted protein [Octopus vulgaris]
MNFYLLFAYIDFLLHWILYCLPKRKNNKKHPTKFFSRAKLNRQQLLHFLHRSIFLLEVDHVRIRRNEANLLRWT